MLYRYVFTFFKYQTQQHSSLTLWKHTSCVNHRVSFLTKDCTTSSSQQHLVGILSHVCRYDSVICIDIISPNVGHLKLMFEITDTSPLELPNHIVLMMMKFAISAIPAFYWSSACHCIRELFNRSQAKGFFISSKHESLFYLIFFFKERKVNLTFPDFPFTTTISLTGQLSTYCHCRQ